MNIALLGGCGYIGSRLFQHLSRNHRVSSFDLELRGNPGRIRNVRSDYRNLRDFRNFDAVILLAGHSSVGACERDQYGALANNLLGPIELAQKLDRQIFIYASSASVYSSSDGKRANVYDFTKAACDEAMRLVRPNHYALRFGTVCGPSPNVRLDLMLNSMVHSAMTQNGLVMQNPTIRRPLLGLDDLCAAVDKCLSDEVPYGPQNLCSVNVTVGEVADAVSANLDVSIKTLPSTEAYNFTMEPASWFKPQETLSSMIEKMAQQYARVKSRNAAITPSSPTVLPAAPTS